MSVNQISNSYQINYVLLRSHIKERVSDRKRRVNRKKKKIVFQKYLVEKYLKYCKMGLKTSLCVCLCTQTWIYIHTYMLIHSHYL